MAIQLRRRGVRRGVLALILVAGSGEAARSQGLPPPPCPLVVPARESFLQPLRIPPSSAAAKNAMGCLSPADAVYGPDGCPLRLCGSAPPPR